MCLAFKIVDATQRKHPVKDQKAGHEWFDSFGHQNPKLSIRSPLPLSYCRAHCVNMDTINDFFGIKAWCYIWAVESHMQTHADL